MKIKVVKFKVSNLVAKVSEFQSFRVFDFRVSKFRV
jgi:hypothetical protein